MPASVTPKCSGTSWHRAIGEAAIDFDHLLRIGVFQRDAIPRKADRVEIFAVFDGRLSIIGVIESSAIVLLFLVGVDAAAVHADAHGAVVVDGQRSPGTRPFPATASRARGGRGAPGCSGACRHAVRRVPPCDSSLAGRSTGWLRSVAADRPAGRVGVFALLSTAIRTTSAPGVVQRLVHLIDCRIDVLRVRGGHALHGDRVIGADHGCADANFAGRVAFDFDHRFILTG